jgi:hypothetical protein
MPAHPTLVLRRGVYERCGVFDTTYRLAADFEFMFRIFHKYRISSVYVPRVLVRMRMGGATGESMRSIHRQNTEILRAMRQHGAAPSVARFYGVKLVDRLAQRIRARFIRPGRVAGLAAR